MKITYRLLSKPRKFTERITLFEVMARLHTGNIDQYAKTGIFVPQYFTDKNGNKKTTWQDGSIVAPKLSLADSDAVQVKEILTEAKKKLSALDMSVAEAFDELVAIKNERPYKGWLQDIINGKLSSDSVEIVSSLCEALSRYIEGQF